MDDVMIVEMYWQRDEDAISETTKKYNRYLTKIAYNILADFEDSKESVNDTYLKAWNSMPPHKPSVLSTYLGKITRQVSIDIFRKRSAKKRWGSEYATSLSELEECIPNSSDPEQELEAKLLAEIITKWLRTLPTETRNVFIGRYYFMDSIKEVAKNNNISESKTKSMLHRTRTGLKEHLGKEGYTL
ncbi:MAG: sigma-70 family RNA polymerase sigma factor [Oscillospiraceae bacterium]|jgi:RNA polymerase sigma-70 factor (ECF subfamily)|nr:sigma-70 family RNA polymerase sigma factor [Oscillospiraceae bacterium]